MTFATLQQESLRLAHGLNDAGMGRGKKIALWLPNRTDWLIWLFAAARIGALVVAVNTRFRSAEVEDILARTKPELLVFEPGFKGIDFTGILAGVSEVAKSGLHQIVATNSDATKNELFSSDTTLFDHGSPDDPIILFTTSGTTSKPKFVSHSQQSLADHARAVSKSLAYDAPETMLLQALPLCGTFGLAQALAAIAAGCPSILMPAFDAGDAVNLIRDMNVTTFNGPDQMFTQIVETANPDDLASIKWCGFAAFSIADTVSFVNECAAGGLHMVGLYGMSETQALYARQPLESSVEDRALAGGVLTDPLAQAEIRDPETGNVLEIGNAGELYLKGPSRFSEYFDNEAATRDAIGKDGFVRTGDLGHITADGRMIFEARMGDSLRLGGFLVNPAEIDNCILQFTGIEQCQTVGVETGRGMRAVSFIIPQGTDVDQAALTDFCKSQMAGFKVPMAIIPVQSYPTSLGPNGEKIQRGKLREMARDLIGSD